MGLLNLAHYFSALLLFLPAASRTMSKVRYGYGGGTVYVTYDRSRYRRADLDRWMSLSPSLSADDLLFIPDDLRSCISGDKRYVNCGSGKPLELRNVDTNISGIEVAREYLDPLKYPEGLRGVATYLQEIQIFMLWRAHHQRDALATHSFAPLGGMYNNLDLSKGCHAVLATSSNSQEKRSFEDVVLVDWANCVWRLESERVGPYPQQQWDAFLRSRGITEKVIEEVPDD